MKPFLIGLQFLTRFKIVRQEVWPDDQFGASVAYFPLVGLVIGIFLALLYWLTAGWFDSFLMAVLLVLAEMTITGGLHADGFMDTCDGYFSGRSRERMLEIMKDSRVGAEGIVGFVFLVLIKIGLYMNISGPLWPLLIIMPMISRWLMSWTIVRFPYARPQGMGKAFADNAPAYTLQVATACLLLAIGVGGFKSILPIIFAFGWMQWVNVHFVRKLGGVTGDTYGAVTETSEIVILLIWLLQERIGVWNLL